MATTEPQASTESQAAQESAESQPAAQPEPKEPSSQELDFSGIDEEFIDDAKSAIAQYDSLTPAQKYQVLNLARKAYMDLDKTQEAKSMPQEETVVDTSEPEDRIAKLEKKLEELRSQQEKSESEKKTKEAVERFNSQVDEILAEHEITSSDPEVAAVIKDAFTAKYLREGSKNVKKDLDKFIESFERHAADKALNWAKIKIKNKQAQGESSAGGAVSVETYEPGPDDLRNGRLAKELVKMAQMG